MIGEDCPIIDATPVKEIFPSGVTRLTIIGGGMHDLRTMPVALTEDYLADENRCWGIAHTTDYYWTAASGGKVITQLYDKRGFFFIVNFPNLCCSVSL
jgi:hypothetical protein